MLLWWLPWETVNGLFLCFNILHTKFITVRNECHCKYIIKWYIILLFQYFSFQRTLVFMPPWWQNGCGFKPHSVLTGFLWISHCYNFLAFIQFCSSELFWSYFVSMKAILLLLLLINWCSHILMGPTLNFSSVSNCA